MTDRDSLSRSLGDLDKPGDGDGWPVGGEGAEHDARFDARLAEVRAKLVKPPPRDLPQALKQLDRLYDRLAATQCLIAIRTKMLNDRTARLKECKRALADIVPALQRMQRALPPPEPRAPAAPKPPKPPKPPADLEMTKEETEAFFSDWS